MLCRRQPPCPRGTGSVILTTRAGSPWELRIHQFPRPAERVLIEHPAPWPGRCSAGCGCASRRAPGARSGSRPVQFLERRHARAWGAAAQRPRPPARTTQGEQGVWMVPGGLRWRAPSRSAGRRLAGWGGERPAARGHGDQRHVMRGNGSPTLSKPPPCTKAPA